MVEISSGSGTRKEIPANENRNALEVNAAVRRNDNISRVPPIGKPTIDEAQ